MEVSICRWAREVSWERWESSKVVGKVGKVYDLSEVTRWERCMGGVRRQVGKGERIMRW